MDEEYKKYIDLAALKALEVVPAFCKTIDEFTDEWNNTVDSVTCECSTNEEFLHEKTAYLLFKSRDLEKKYNKHAFWRINLCGTCFGYHKEAPYHVEIWLED